MFSVHSLHRLKKDQQRRHGKPESASRRIDFCNEESWIGNFIFREWYETGSGEQRRINVEDGVVEVERIHIRQNVFLRYLVRLLTPLSQIQHISVSYHRALGKSRG